MKTWCAREPGGIELAVLAKYLLEVRLPHHVFRREDPARGKFKRLTDIGYQFVQDLALLLNRDVHSPWPAPVVAHGPDVQSKPSKDTHKKGCSMMFKEMSADGSITNSKELLMDRGFVLERFVVQKVTETRFKILRVNASDVELRDSAGVDLTILHPGSLQNEFKTVEIEKPELVFDHRGSVKNDFDWQFEIIACRIKLALKARHGDTEKGGGILIEPARSKGVRTKVGFAKSALTLYPATPLIYKADKTTSDEVNGIPTSIEITNAGLSKTFNIYLGKKDVFPQAAEAADRGFAPKASVQAFVAPCWHVERVDDGEHACKINMSLSEEKVTIDVCEDSVTILIPYLVNSRAIKKGEYVVARKETPEEKIAKAAQPPQQKRCV